MRSQFVVLAIIIASLLIPSSLWAKTVYFKNGDELECQSYRQQGDRIFVNINSETELNFALEDVDADKTPEVNRKIDKGRNVTDGADNANSREQAVHESEAVPPPPEQMAYWSAGETPEGYRPGTFQLQKILAAVFEKYNRAAQAGDFKEVVKYMPLYQAQKSTELLSKVKDKNERMMRKKVLQGMAVKGFTVTKCAVSPDGKTAVLAGNGKMLNDGKFQDKKGTIKFDKEKGDWKVAFQIWS